MDEDDRETGEMHSEEDKALSDKNKKRKVKTRAQIQALEEFYNEHKYPTESMKIEVASSIDLTENQISGWFCRRRLKDRRLTNAENNTTAQKQDLSSGVVVQDSGGSTKQTCNKQLDTREVESGRLTLKYDGDYNIATEGSSESNSSMRDKCNKPQNILNPCRVTASRHAVTRFPLDEGVIKRTTGPSGYLKVKGHVENSTITEVKKRLGNDYRIDGPPLAVEFDILPLHAFLSSMQDTDDDETCYTEEAVLPTLHDASRLHQIPKFYEGREYNSSDETCFKTKRGYDAANHFARLDNNTNRNSSIKFTEGSVRDVDSIRNREEYKFRHSPDENKVAITRFPSDHYTQTVVDKVRKSKLIEPTLYHKCNGEGTKISHEENTEKKYAYNMSMKAKGYDGSGDKVPLKQIRERRVKMKNDFNAHGMKWEEFTPQRQSKRYSIPQTQRLNRFESEISPSSDGEGAETTSSMD